MGRDFGLTARHQNNKFRALAQTKRQRIVGRGVACVQCGHHVDPIGQVAACNGFDYRFVEEPHLAKTKFLRQRNRTGD